jgi:hypothetical protein
VCGYDSSLNNITFVRILCEVLLELINKVKCTGSLWEKELVKKCHALTEGKLKKLRQRQNSYHASNANVLHKRLAFQNIQQQCKEVT